MTPLEPCNNGERRLFVGAGAARRRGAIGDSLLPGSLLVISATVQSAKALIRSFLPQGQCSLGVEPTTLYGLAQRLAVPVLAEESRVPIGYSSEIALTARIISLLHEESKLGRYAVIAGKPGLAKALSRTLQELRMQSVTPVQVATEAPDLARVYEYYLRELELADFADRSDVYRAAQKRLAQGGALRAVPLVLHDIKIRSLVEEGFVTLLAANMESVVATAASLDRLTITGLKRSLEVSEERLEVVANTNLERAQLHLFAEHTAPTEPDASLQVYSAPGENREAVELARRALKLASQGVAFDQMAVVVRQTEQYRSHLAEALRRANIPVNFAKGTRRPDPSGRALLSLIDCALAGLSASKFAEYLSLGVAPTVVAGGGPPEAKAGGDRFEPGDEYPGPAALGQEEEESTEPGYASPKRWERLLVDAAVLGGSERWHRRLDGLEAEFCLRIASFDDPDDPGLARAQDRQQTLANLRAFALPLVEDLGKLPADASWGYWVDRLGGIASRAIRNPSRVLAVLSELQPMAQMEDVPLLVVRQVLSARLASIVDPPSSNRQGALLVGTPDDIRGLGFRVVFIVGLAEKIFPPKVLEDPILLDRHRRRISDVLPTNEDRLLDERLALAIALGGASEKVLVSYPRIDSDQARPRVPSFYALELFRAAEGRLTGFAELALRARDAGRARTRWPAPENPKDAIDEAEFDLAVLEGLLHGGGEKGAARYLLETNKHLARALRFRGKRWLRKWTEADGLIGVADPARAELGGFLLHKRPYSATALQTFAACPYRFYLRTILRLEARDVIEPIEELDPLQRGSLVHDVQFRVLRELRDKAALPITEATHPQAELVLVSILRATADEYREDLAPAIEHVWADGVSLLEKDLKRWLRGLMNSQWVPEHFELAFGLPNFGERDVSSRAEPAELACGIQFRGSIDLVERKGDKIRATDHKTGKKPPSRHLVIHGGEILQPVLYAMALEQLFEGTEVDAGRLSFCTERGEFSEEIVPLDKAARAAAELVVKTINETLEKGFLPAAPREGACTWCDYQAVCSPYEEFRTRRKNRGDLQPLTTLRRQS